MITITDKNIETFLNTNLTDWNAVEFVEITFKNHSFYNLHISKACFISCKFENCDFHDNIIFNVRFENCEFNSCIIHDGSITDGIFVDNKMIDFTIKHLFLTFLTFTNNSFHNCTIEYVDFHSCYFCKESHENLKYSHIKFIGENDVWQMQSYEFFNDIPLICPDTGSFIGWKKCYSEQSKSCIVKLEITEDALRSSGYSRKCRASKVKVLEIQDIAGNLINTNIAHSIYDRNFIYRVGETIEVKNFDKNRFETCAPGIHFFITRKEAVDYSL